MTTTTAHSKDLFGTATFDSWRYHYTLYVLGGAQAEHLRSLASSRHWPQIISALAKPTVYDDVLAYFNRIGVRVPGHVLERDPSVPYVPSLEVEQIWREIYEDPYPDATLQQLGETLMDTATALTDWKCRCLMTMRRTLVERPTSIPDTSEISFPELWSARRCVTGPFHVQT